MMKKYYTESGEKIRNPTAYAKTGAPMYQSKSWNDTKDINASTTIYKMKLEGGKKYIGKTTDIDRRMNQHFSGNGSQVTKKFKPVEGEVIDEVPGFFSDQAEQEHTEYYIQKHGYNNVRGGKYVNSKTLKKNKPSFQCYRCGRQGHMKQNCYAKTHINGYSLKQPQEFYDDSDGSYDSDMCF